MFSSDRSALQQDKSLYTILAQLVSNETRADDDDNYVSDL